MPVLALVLAAALATDGGALPASDGGVRDLYALCPPSDVPPAVQTDAGDWMVPALRMERINCRLGACEHWIEGRRAGATQEPLVLPSGAAWIAIAASVVATFIVGVYIGVKMDQALQKP